MPAQKRRHPSPSSKPRDHVEANGTASSSTAAAAAAGGGGGRGVHPVPGGAAANRATDPKPPRVAVAGELNRIETSRISLSRSARRVLFLGVNTTKRHVCSISYGFGRFGLDGQRKQQRRRV